MTAKKEGFCPVCSKGYYKKGQVTIFIILGIALIAGAVLFFVLRSDTNDFPTEPVIVEVPSD